MPDYSSLDVAGYENRMEAERLISEKAEGEFLRERLEAKLKDKELPERLTAELDQAVLWSKPTQLNADGTIAIKGEAAEQLKALIREVLAEQARRLLIYGFDSWGATVEQEPT